MKRILAVLACLILNTSVMAQEATGEPITFVDSCAFEARLSKGQGTRPGWQAGRGAG